MNAAPDSMTVDELAAAMTKSAGAIHDRIAETGPRITLPKAEDTKVHIGRLAELGVITAEDVADLNSLWDEITNEQAPQPHARITAAGNRLYGRDNSSQVAVTIASIAMASVARAAKSPTFASWGATIAYDVGGGILGGIGGAIAGEMVMGKPGAIAGGIAGAIICGGLASSSA